MKTRFEAGKTYKNRRNEEIKILVTDAENSRYPIIALHVKSGSPLTYTADGSHVFGGDTNSYDLVPEPRSLEVTVYLNVEQDGTLGASFVAFHDVGDNMSGARTIGKAKVTILENVK